MGRSDERGEDVPDEELEATEAMLQMQKIEIEQIRAAVDAVSAGASTS